jgi:hypothetical protein
MSTATHSRGSSAQTKGQRELATLKSLETLTNAGLLQDAMVSHRPELRWLNLNR